MIGRTPAELFLWEKPELADQWVESLLREETVRDQEAKIRTKAGDLHEVLVSLSPVALAKEPHMLLLAQDVAERVLLERQLRQAQKMEAIGQLAAGVAHDFNNILTVIQGHAGLMQQTLAAGNPPTKSLEQISKAADRAATLIQRLLMFSRKQVMQFRHLDLNETLGSTIKMLERLVGEQVQIDFRPQTSHPGHPCRFQHDGTNRDESGGQRARCHAQRRKRFHHHLPRNHPPRADPHGPGTTRWGIRLL